MFPKSSEDRLKELENRIGELENRIDKNLAMIHDTFATMQDIIEKVSETKSFAEKREYMEKNMEKTKKPRMDFKDVFKPARNRVKENFDFIRDLAKEDLIELTETKRKKRR